MAKDDGFCAGASGASHASMCDFTLDWSTAEKSLALPKAGANAVTNLLGPAFSLPGCWIDYAAALLLTTSRVLREHKFFIELMPKFHELEEEERHFLQGKPPEEQERLWVLENGAGFQGQAIQATRGSRNEVVATLSMYGETPTWVHFQFKGEFLETSDWQALEMKLRAAFEAQHIFLTAVPHGRVDDCSEEYGIAMAGVGAECSLSAVTGGAWNELGTLFRLHYKGLEVGRALCVYHNASKDGESSFGGPALQMLEVNTAYQSRGFGKALLSSIEGLLRARFMECFLASDEGPQTGLRLTTCPMHLDGLLCPHLDGGVYEWFTLQGFDDEEGLCEELDSDEEQYGDPLVARTLAIGLSKNILWPRPVA